jgi:purine-binding chemotaxis protein CheW
MSNIAVADEATEQFVVIRLGDEFYGLPILSVDEVVRRPNALTRVPHAPAFVEGVMNLRGTIVPVIDQRQRFVIGGDKARTLRIVIVTIDGLRAGFVVDAVSEVLSIPTAEISITPELTADGAEIFDRVANIEREGRMILLIDPKALLNRAERDVLAAITARAAPAS